MIRLMFALFALMWSALLDTDGGAGGGEGGGSAGETFQLTETELTNRTNAAAAAKQKEIAELLGIDPDKIADAKGLIEAGRKANQPPADDQPTGDKSGEEKAIEDKIAELLKPFTDRLGQIEQTEQQRREQAAEQTRTEKLEAALKEANVREDRLEAARAVTLANGVKLNDKGELEGSKEAIEATRKALPEAFRGDGDDGKAADATTKDGKPKPRNLVEALTAHYSGQK